MKRTTLTMLIVAVAMISSVSASAQAHPAYLQAVSNLRIARAVINQHTNTDLGADELAAVKAIDGAISDIKKAGIDDGKKEEALPAAEKGKANENRLQRGVELLNDTRNDIDKKEDDKFSPGLKARVLHHIDEALAAVKRAQLIKK